MELLYRIDDTEKGAETAVEGIYHTIRLPLLTSSHLHATNYRLILVKSLGSIPWRRDLSSQPFCAGDTSQTRHHHRIRRCHAKTP